MDLRGKRVTQLTVLPNIAAAVRRYEALGFERVPGENPELVGFLAGKTGVMLATTDFLAKEVGSELAERLEGLTFPYIYVNSVETSLAALPPGAVVLNDVTLPEGTREILVEDATGHMILADTNARRADGP